MRHLRQTALTGCLLLLALPAPAEEDGGGMIQRFIQDQLSSGGRDVKIRGFEGLLSGAAKLKELTIADKDGVWLTLRDAELNWSRAALLRGDLSVETLSAGELIVARLPKASGADASAEAPSAEASGFALPELPISIRIGKLAIDRAELGAEVIGQHAVLSLDGSVQLADGEGSVSLDTQRIDERDDHVSIEGSFMNESRVLSLDLALEEEAGGIVGTALRIPDAPSLSLTVKGDGPLSDFAADVGLSSGGAERISGNVLLKDDTSGNRGIAADIGGDVTPLVPAAFDGFFGTDTRLKLDGTRRADGSLDLRDFSLTSQALALNGGLSLGVGGLPTAFDITGTMGRSDGAPLQLPVPGPGTWLDALTLNAEFDAAKSDQWTLAAQATGLDTASAKAEVIALKGGGTISAEGGATATGEITLSTAGLAMSDPGLAQALGSTLHGSAALAWKQGGALNVTQVNVEGVGLSAGLLGDLRFQNRSLHVSGDGQAAVSDLARFSALAGRTLAGEVSAKFSGEGDPLGGQFDLTAALEGSGLSVGDDTVDRLLAGPVTLDTAVKRDTDGTELKQFELRSKGVSADASGQIGSGRSDVSFTAALSDLGLVLPGRTGAVTLTGKARETSLADWQAALDLTGPYGVAGKLGGRIHSGDSDLTLDLSVPDIAPFAPGHVGAVALNGKANETGGGGWTFNLDGSAPYEASLKLDGVIGVSGAPGKITFLAALPDMAPLVPGLKGALNASGTATDAGNGIWQVAFDATGPAQAEASVQGEAGGGKTSLKADISVPRMAAFAAGVPGGLTATANAAQGTGGAWDFAVDAKGPYASSLLAGGSYGGGKGKLDVKAALPDVGRLAPGFSGPVSLDGTAVQTGAESWKLAFDAGLPYGGKAKVAGALAGAATALDVSVDMPSIAPFAPGLSGGISAKGSVSPASGAYAIKLETKGPQGATSLTTGTVSTDFSKLALTSRGKLLLGLANGMISPVVADGAADFNMTVNGPPALASVSGQITVNGGELVLPTVRQSLENIDLRLGLKNGRFDLDGRAAAPAGGTFGLKGTIGLDAALTSRLTADFASLVLTDPSLYKTTLNGSLAMNGPLLGGATIEGRLKLDNTEIRIADGGLGFGGAIPEMRHLNEPADVYLTRERAGLVDTDDDTQGGGGGASYGLKLTISAPDEIFIRGRGLDTELGGNLVVGGTTDNPSPVGEIKVVRGRLDILGKRLDITEGSLTLAGGLNPWLDLTASSTSDDFEFVATVSGPVSDPKFTLTSVPDLPQDEVLARFLFGVSVTDLSPLQAAQMAGALATLTGRGGVGLMANLRSGLGLDDLDLAETDAGSTEVRAGKYLTDKIYTEVVADSLGGTEINLNIDLTKTVTIKGGAGSVGGSSLGIYFERDY